MNALQELAKTVIEVAGDDIASAKALARDEAAAKPEIAQLLRDYAIDVLIDGEWRAGRQRRWNAATSDDAEPIAQPMFGETVPSPVLREGLRLSVESIKKRMMAWEMEPGKRIGDATKPDLLLFGNRNLKQAETERIRGLWYLAVAGMMPDDKQKVKDVLREADLVRLKKRVEKQRVVAA